MKRYYCLLILSFLVGCSIQNGKLGGAIPTLRFQAPGAAPSMQVPSLTASASDTPVHENSPASTSYPTEPLIMATQTLFPTQTPFASIRKMRDDLMYEIYILQKTMPRSDSQAYIAPTKSEVSDFTQLISLLLAGDTSKALQMASRINYTLLQYSDLHDNNQPSIVLRENKGDLKGWGLYALRMISDSPVVIEAPHPLADGQTAEIALQLYRGLDARALLVAGSHRNANADGSSDVAHQQASIFQAVHDSLVMPGSVVLQVHGFSSTKHSDHPQVIIGQSGSGDSLLAGQIAKALEEAGVSSGVCAGDAWKDLCGETNAQASTIGEGIFLHLELDETIRSRPKTFLKVMEEIFVP